MKMVSCLIASLLLFTACERPKGFSIDKIISRYQPDPKWDAKSLPEIPLSQVEEIFARPLTYLGSGNHCYAFSSEDGHYVVKFFKQKHMDIHHWKHHLPLVRLLRPSLGAKLKRRLEEREESYTSYLIAYDELRDLSGLVYLHLNKSDEIKGKATLIDQHGNALKVNLPEMEFLIQRRAKVGLSHLSELIQEGKCEEALASATSLLKLAAKRGEQGIYDRDMQLFKNFGFVDGQPIEIDVGEYRRNPHTQEGASLHLELLDLSRQIHLYFEKHHPELQSELKHLLERELEALK